MICFLMVQMQADRVRESATGEGLIHDSSQFTEPVFKLFKDLCARHCNGQPGWLHHIAKLTDAIALGGLYCEVVDLHAVENHRAKVNGIIQETVESKKWDKDMIASTSDEFKSFVEACELIDLPDEKQPIEDCFPRLINDTMNRWRTQCGADDMHGNSVLKPSVLNIVTNNENTLMIVVDNLDDENNEAISYEHYPSLLVNVGDDSNSEDVSEETYLNDGAGGLPNSILERITNARELAANNINN